MTKALKWLEYSLMIFGLAIIIQFFKELVNGKEIPIWLTGCYSLFLGGWVFSFIGIVANQIIEKFANFNFSFQLYDTNFENEESDEEE